MKSLIIIFFILISFSYFFIMPPVRAPKDIIIKVENGSSIISVAKKLKEKKIIRSVVAFQTLVLIYGDKKGIIAGDYLFENPTTSYSVAKRMVTGDFRLKPIKITIPEGFSSREIAKLISEKIDGFDFEKLYTTLKDSEGYLFPETYFFSPVITIDEIKDRLINTFNQKTEKLKKETLSLKKNFSEIIIMASIIEKETLTDNERPIVAGILWKRMEKKLLLQVDAPSLYLLGKESSELTLEDLKINSPYNTYKNKGLPPTSISNPGIESITASLYPKFSPYLFYLHGRDGKIYYAKNYEEHLQNKKKYLK